MINKKGWIKIVEAVIAVLLIAGVLIMFYARSFETPRSTQRVYELEKAVLEEVALDKDYRRMVLENSPDGVNSYVRDRIMQLLPGFNYSIAICNPEDICPAPYYDREIYASERIVSANLDKYSPKKLKIFVWRL